jgi:hypothetical protein
MKTRSKIAKAAIAPACDAKRNCTQADERSAYYQAGPAVIATLLGLEVEAVSINSDDTYSSWISIRKPEYGEMNCPVDRLAKFSVLKALLAGPAAKMRYSFGGVSTIFDPSDRELLQEPVMPRALGLAAELPDNGLLITSALWRVLGCELAQPEIWSTVEAVARALINDGEISGSTVEKIVWNSMRPVSNEMVRLHS